MTENETNFVGSTWEDVLDPEMKSVVPKFWLKFKPPPIYVQYILGTIYIIIMSVGVLGNLIIMWIFCTTKRLRKPSNYLVMNLAFSDLLMLHKMVIFIYNSFSGGPKAGPRWCTYYGVMGGLSGTSAIMTIAMMAIERYVCVSRPLDPSSRMTKSRALAMVMIIWIYSSAFSIVPLFGPNRYVPEGYLTSCSFDYLSDELNSRIFVMVFFAAAWCVPMIIVCRCYVGIVLSVYENQQIFMHHSQSINLPDRNVMNQKRLEIRLAKISFCLISLWTIAWTPYAVVALLGVFTDKSMLTPLTSMLPALTCKMASVLDPFVYGLSNRQFKDEFFIKLLSVCKSKQLQNRMTMPSFIRRVISMRSQEHSDTNENADISFSEKEDCETALNAEEFQPVDKITDRISMKESKINRSLSRKFPNIQNSISSRGFRFHSDGEINNNAGLKSMRVYKIPIPQIYIIERYSDIIKIASRRSI